jgi:hypothetical protein
LLKILRYLHLVKYSGQLFLTSAERHLTFNQPSKEIT